MGLIPPTYIDAPVPHLPITPPTRTGDATIGANSALGFSFNVPRTTKVRRIRLRVAVQSGAVSAAIYDMTRARVVTSGAVGVGIAGKAMEIALPPTTLQPGVYQLWLSTSDGTVSVGVNSTYGDLVMGEVMTSAHPLPLALSGTTMTAQAVSMVVMPDDPVGLAASPVYVRTDLGVSVIGQKTGGRLYGTNTTTGHYVYSDNDGTSWTDTLISPISVTPNALQIVTTASFMFAITSDGKIYRNALDTWTGWTDVSVSGVPAGTTGRPDIFTSNGTYIYYGNYNGTTNEGAHVYRSSDNGATWTETLTVSTARHVHAIYVDPNSTQHVWVTVGDAGYVGKGLYYSADGGATWTYLSNNIYGINMVLPAAVTGVPQRLILEGDGANQPHLMRYYANLVTGTTNLTDPLLWYDASPNGGASWVGTARGICLTSEGNIFYISTGEGGAVGTRYGLWLCRGPWFTTPTLLEEITQWANFGKTYESGNYLINFRYRMTKPKFCGQ